jgi:hypothetical protein
MYIIETMQLPHLLLPSYVDLYDITGVAERLRGNISNVIRGNCDTNIAPFSAAPMYPGTQALLGGRPRELLSLTEAMYFLCCFTLKRFATTTIN